MHLKLSIITLTTFIATTLSQNPCSASCSFTPITDHFPPACGPVPQVLTMKDWECVCNSKLFTDVVRWCIQDHCEMGKREEGYKVVMARCEPYIHVSTRPTSSVLPTTSVATESQRSTLLKSTELYSGMLPGTTPTTMQSSTVAQPLVSTSSQVPIIPTQTTQQTQYVFSSITPPIVRTVDQPTKSENSARSIHTSIPASSVMNVMWFLLGAGVGAVLR